MAQPLLARLREKLPQGSIDALAAPWVAPVLRRMPEVARVIEAPFAHGALQLSERWRLGRSLRAASYRQAIVLPNSWKSALVPFFADIPIRSGYVGESRYGLLNLLYRARNAERAPMALHYARLAERPGAEPAQEVAPPRLRVDPAAAAAAARRFGIDGARSLAVLCPGAEYGPAKRWPAERFGALAAELAARGLEVRLLGAASDAPECALAESASAGAAKSLAGQTSLDDAIELIAQAALVVSNDSGLMHIAAALERPQVALFGSSSPQHTPPASRAARIVWLGIECSPCFARECPLGHFRCMREIPVERVAAEAQQALAQ
jgi:heptosyltransferase-2